MINVTDSAKEELKRILTRSVDWPGARLRLMDRGEGKLGLGVDIESENDRVIEYEGDALLVVDANLASRCGLITLDVENTEDGAEIVICKRA